MSYQKYERKLFRIRTASRSNRLAVILSKQRQWGISKMDFQHTAAGWTHQIHHFLCPIFSRWINSRSFGPSKKISDMKKIKVEVQWKATRIGYDPDVPSLGLLTSCKNTAGFLPDLRSRNEWLLLPYSRWQPLSHICRQLGRRFVYRRRHHKEIQLMIYRRQHCISDDPLLSLRNI